ncbi:hypothetical protein ABZY19_33865 [Streptomyces sp. NPDC006475]|uniref:hypothetical protein n=1 Tax=Streptomyces sp. NPDC006475 TaxID=3155719 RepID=UPI0033AA54A5
MNSSVRTWRRGLATSAAVLLLGVGAVACGGDDKPAADDKAVGSTAADEKAVEGPGADQNTGGDDSATGSEGVTYAACMRRNGVDVADPEPGEQPRLPKGVAQSLLDKAEKKCGEAPGSQQQAGGGEFANDPRLEELTLRNQKCMRENGYEIPETKKDGMMPKAPGEDPVLDRAQKACEATTGKALREYIHKVTGKQ